MKTCYVKSSANVFLKKNKGPLKWREAAFIWGLVESQHLFTFGPSCPFYFCSYTYWWTPEVIKHLPLPYDEGEYLLLFQVLYHVLELCLNRLKALAFDMLSYGKKWIHDYVAILLGDHSIS